MPLYNPVGGGAGVTGPIGPTGPAGVGAIPVSNVGMTGIRQPTSIGFTAVPSSYVNVRLDATGNISWDSYLQVAATGGGAVVGPLNLMDLRVVADGEFGPISRTSVGSGPSNIPASHVTLRGPGTYTGWLEWSKATGIRLNYMQQGQFKAIALQGANGFTGPQGQQGDQGLPGVSVMPFSNVTFTGGPQPTAVAFSTVPSSTIFLTIAGGMTAPMIWDAEVQLGVTGGIGDPNQIVDMRLVVDGIIGPVSRVYVPTGIVQMDISQSIVRGPGIYTGHLEWSRVSGSHISYIQNANLRAITLQGAVGATGPGVVAYGGNSIIFATSPTGVTLGQVETVEHTPLYGDVYSNNVEARTTDATQTNLFTWVVVNNAITATEISVTAITEDSNTAAYYKKTMVLRKDTNILASIGPTIDNLTIEDTAALQWNVIATGNGLNGQILVQGFTGTSIRWSGSIRRQVTRGS